MSEAVPAGEASRASSLPLLPLGIVAGLVQALAMIPGYHDDNDKFQTTTWLVMAAVAIVLGALLFKFVVPNGSSTTALVLGVLGLLTVAVFWAMVSLPLSAAGLVTAMRARDRGETNGKVKVALILSIIGVVGTFAAIIGDAMSN